MFAVKLYGSEENLEGYPPEWPCNLLTIEREDQVPEGYMVMADDEYEKHLETHRPAYQDWEMNVKNPINDKYNNVYQAAKLSEHDYLTYKAFLKAGLVLNQMQKDLIACHEDLLDQQDLYSQYRPDIANNLRNENV